MMWTIEQRDVSQREPSDGWQIIDRIWKGDMECVETVLRKYVGPDAHVEWLNPCEAHTGDGTMHYRAQFGSLTETLFGY